MSTVNAFSKRQSLTKPRGTRWTPNRRDRYITGNLHLRSSTHGKNQRDWIAKALCHSSSLKGGRKESLPDPSPNHNSAEYDYKKGMRLQNDALDAFAKKMKKAMESTYLNR